MTITDWRKSSYSSSYNGCVEAGNWRTSSRCEGGACLEAGNWRASSACGSTECAEVASCGHGVAVRDSTLGASSPVLSFGAGEWDEFAARIRKGTAVGGDD